jgi:molecular chaperone GrpE
MSEPAISNHEEDSSSCGQRDVQDQLAGQSQPQFGLLEVIEAFTAMRHEWRTQTKENRQLTDSVQATAELLRQMESTLDQKLGATTNDQGLQKLIGLVIDLDISLQRAVTATANNTINTQEQPTALANSIRQSYQKTGFFSRWFSRKFFQNVIETIENATQPTPDPANEGIRLVLVRLRRMMAEQGLRRVETLGEIFDAETMNAISTLSSDQYDEGCVAEEISPAYFFHGRLIRFAEVRVAQKRI